MGPGLKQVFEGEYGKFNQESHDANCLMTYGPFAAHGVFNILQAILDLNHGDNSPKGYLEEVSSWLKQDLLFLPPTATRNGDH